MKTILESTHDDLEKLYIDIYEYHLNNNYKHYGYNYSHELTDKKLTELFNDKKRNPEG